MGVFDSGSSVDIGFVLFNKRAWLVFFLLFSEGRSLNVLQQHWLEYHQLAASALAGTFLEGVPRLTISVYKHFVFGRRILLG